MRFALRQLPALGLALLSWSATGQNSPAQPSTPVLPGLGQLTRSSGYIFDGTVMSVEPVAQDLSNGLAAVQITFRVEQAIRGVRGGQVLVIREWAGLWNSGERYRPGERLLLFLYSPSSLGLTSVVGGPFGRFPVDSGGNAVFEKGRVPALSFDPASQAQLRQKNRVKARALALAIQREDPK
jgi:hypothetical protein